MTASAKRVTASLCSTQRAASASWFTLPEFSTANKTMETPANTQLKDPASATLIQQAALLAARIKEAEETTDPYAAIEAEADAAIDDLLGSAAEALAIIERQRETILKPYQERIDAIQHEAEEKKAVAAQEAADRKRRIAADRIELGSVMAKFYRAEGAKTTLCGRYPVTVSESRSITVSDQARALETIMRKAPENWGKYVVLATSAIELVAALAAIKKGDDLEAIASEVSKDFPGFVFETTYTAKIAKPIEEVSAAASQGQEPGDSAALAGLGHLQTLAQVAS